MTRARYVLGIVTALVGLAMGCGGGSSGNGGHLIEGKKPSRDQAAEQIRQQHKIHVYFSPNEDGTNGQWYEVSQDSLISSTYWNCQYLTSNQETTCSSDLKTTGQRICTYINLLRVMEAGIQPFTAHTKIVLPKLGEVEGYITIPRQSVATIAVLAQYLNENPLFNLTGKEFADCSVSGDLLTPVKVTPTSTIPSVADQIAKHMKVAAELTEEMTKVAVKNILAAADATRASAPPGLGAEKQAWMQPILSRSAAANMLLGGNFEDQPGLGEGFCPGRPLGGPEKKAVELLRTSGVSVDDLANETLSTNDLLHSDDRNATDDAGYSDPKLGSVALRLAIISGDEKSSSLPTKYGISESDFDRARKYLVAESSAFARDRTLTSGVIRDSSGKNIFNRYAASTLPASVTPDGFYSAMATGSVPSDPVTGDEIVSGALSHTHYFAAKQLQSLKAYVDAHENVFPTDLASIRGTIASGLTWAASDVSSVVRWGTYSQGPGTPSCPVVSINVPDPSDQRTKLLAKGETALNCALSGRTGTDVCTAEFLKSRGILIGSGSPSAGSPYPNGTSYWRTFCPSGTTPSFIEEGVHYYLLTQKDGSQGNPGDFSLDLGFVYHNGASTFVGVRSLQAEAADALRPSETWCNTPRKSCAGASFDERLPLEDELTGDSDGVESSWKHYLTLAKDAASQADSLGQSYVEASLQYDQKISEDERYEESRRQQLSANIETLQDACGTALDVDKIKEALFGNVGQSCTSDQQCTGVGKCAANGKCQVEVKSCSKDSPCGDNQACIGGVCMISPGKTCSTTNKCANGQTCVGSTCLASATSLSAGDIDEINRLQRCIAAQPIEFAALGDRPLCVAAPSNESSDYCPEDLAGSGIRCPEFADTTDALGICHKYGERLKAYVTASNGKVRELVPIEVPLEHALRLFSVAATTGEGQNEVCKALSAARKGYATVDASEISPGWTGSIDTLDFLANNDYLLPTEVKELTKRIGFETRFGTYAAVTLDQAPLHTTGALDSPAKDWPCASAQHPATSVANESLLETYINCEPDLSSDDPATRQAEIQKATEARARMNDRLMRAVIALRFVGGVSDTSNLSFPLLFPVTTPDPVVARRLTFKPYGTGEVVTAYEGRDSRGLQSVFWSNEGDYPAYYTMWNDSQPTKMLLHGMKLLSGGSSWDVRFGIGELQTTTLTTGGTTVSSSCHWEYWPFPHQVCSTTTTYVPQVTPISTASWLNGLYRTSLSIDPAEARTYGANWFKNALKAKTENLQPTELPGAILFNTTTQVEFSDSTGKHYYKAYANNAQLAFGEVLFSSFTMLDALELACKMKGESVNNIVIDLNKIPPVTGPQDFPALQSYMDGLAQRIEDWAGTFVLSRVPADALDFSRSQSKAGAFPKIGGSYASAVTTLRGDLVTLSEVAPMLAEEIRLLGLQLTQAKNAIGITNNDDVINKLQKEARDIQRITDCEVAQNNAPSLDYVHAIGAGLAATAVCISGVAQSMLDSQVVALQHANAVLTNQQTLIQLQQEILKHGEALQKYTNQISDALENIDGHLAEIERQRNKAQLAAVEAIRELAFENPASQVVKSDIAAIRETARIRYEYAFDVAKRAAFLARRAIEQRLAVNMDEMVDDMPLVEAPQRWASTVCERSGIDWSEVQASHPDAPASFADTFIGDYVDKLSRVVESYRLDHNFHEGTDTSVVSMRDDVLAVRSPCDVEVDNQLLNTSNISVEPVSDDLLGGWRPLFCTERTDASGNTLRPENCVVPVSVEDTPFPNFTREFGAPKAFRLVYGIDEAGFSGTCPSGTSCDFTEFSAWGQRVKLKGGRYRLSWYSTGTSPTNPNDPNSKPALDVWMSLAFPGQGYLIDAQGFGYEETGRGSDIRSGKIWFRAWSTFDIQQKGNDDVDVDVYMYRDHYHQNDYAPLISGPMLENITAANTSSKPKPFSATTDTRTRRLDVCQDTSGDLFRSKWVRKCVPLCPDGNTGTCPAASAVQQCYWEVPFTIAQSRLLAGQEFKQAGFAQGNFNYRINSIGVNVVGTGVKNCANTLLPSTCYSSGNLTYSLDHIGPYMVRNYGGTDYESKLFTGHIEHARGLAAERYITNPISSADQQLLDQYMRTELQGRPLDGNFILKIWDDPNTSFDGVQDIQVVLKYSYWTRFD